MARVGCGAAAFRPPRGEEALEEEASRKEPLAIEALAMEALAMEALAMEALAFRDGVELVISPGRMESPNFLSIVAIIRAYAQRDCKRPMNGVLSIKASRLYKV